jgi:hypothetical protein
MPLYAQTEAFDALAASWARWVYCAGLEQVDELQRGLKRR